MRNYVPISLLVFILGLLASHLANGEMLKVASLYGRYTVQDDIYKQIVADAASYINDDRGSEQLVRPGDQFNLIHIPLLNNGREFKDQTVSKTTYQICNEVRNADAAAIILPSDFCRKCGSIGKVIGDAYSPVMALDQSDGSGAFKMRPKRDEIEEMITDVIDNFKWSTFIYLWQGGQALHLGRKMAAKAMDYGWTILPIKLDIENFEQQAEDLKTRRMKNILIYATNEDLLKSVVDDAFETKLLSNGYHWIFGNPNPPISKEFLDTKYRHNMAYLTRFKMEANELGYYTSIEKPVKKWRFRQRAAYDALVAVARAMKLHRDREGRYPDSVAGCGQSERSTLEPYLKQIGFFGASGFVQFNEHGDRVNYTIKIYSGKDKFAQNLAGFFTQDVKSWEAANGQKWPGKAGKRTYLKPFRQSDANRIRVLAVPEPPFFMKTDWENTRYKEGIEYTQEELGNEPYSGYSWELIKEVKKVFEEEMGLDFDYEIILMNRGQYGNKDLSTGEWDGMIRKLVDVDADLAIGSLQKNGERENDIDFTAKWYSSQLKMAILHPSWTFEYPFSLVYPFHVTAWFALIVVFIIVSLVTFIIGYCDPYEYRRLAERGRVAPELADTFGIFDSVFYVLSTGFWQGYTRGPRSWSLRLLSAFWFWFALCMIFLYASVAKDVFKFSKTGIKIKDVHDLLHNEVYEFGAVRHSPSMDFYRYNKGQYRMVYDRMLNSEKNLIEDKVENAAYRMRRQWNGRYTLLGEERILSYAVDRRPCRLYVTGKTLGKITFSFATPSGSPLRDQMSYALKILKKRGNITRILEKKYSKYLDCAGNGHFEELTKKSYSLHDLQGMYYLMFIFLGGSFIVFILEWLFYVLFIGDETSRPSFKAKPSPHKRGKKKDDDIYGGDPAGAGDATNWI